MDIAMLMAYELGAELIVAGEAPELIFPSND